MTAENPQKRKFIMDLEKLNTYNAEGCPACGMKFNLGDSVLVAKLSLTKGFPLMLSESATTAEQ